MSCKLAAAIPWVDHVNGRGHVRKTVTVAASNADQTAYFQAQVNSLADGDALVIAPGNHYIGAYIDIWFNYGSLSGDDTGLLFDHTSLDVVQGCQCYYNYMCGISQNACTDPRG